MKNEVVLVGSVNLGGIADDGETMKNRMIIDVLRKYVDKVHVVDVRNKPNRVLYLLKLLFFLLFKRKCKVVFSASSFVVYSLIKIAFWLRYDKNNIYYWVIGGRFGEYLQNGEIEKEYYKDIHTIIVEGNSMQKTLESVGLTNVITLSNFKNINYIPQKIRRTSDSILRFVFLSRIIPEKGVDYIFDAVNKLLDGGIENFVVDFYGKIEAHYEIEFNNKISNCGHTYYKGFLDLRTENGYDVLSSYDVMLFPTYWAGEGFPGIIVDAFIAGLPVIASDWNLNSSIINEGKNGFLIKVHDVDALARKMQEAILNRDVIFELGCSVQKNAYKYDTNTVVNYDLLNNIGLI